MASLFLAPSLHAPPLHAEDAAAGAAGDEPAPVTLIHPADGAVVPSGRRDTRVGLAWQGSHARPPLWYFVEVLASDPGQMRPSQTREVFTGYTRQTELRVRLDGAGLYAWHVVAVDRASARYSVSPWRSFTVEGASGETR